MEVNSQLPTVDEVTRRVTLMVVSVMIIILASSKMSESSSSLQFLGSYARNYISWSKEDNVYVYRNYFISEVWIRNP